MSPTSISNEALSLTDVPDADAPFQAVRQFGRSFNGYEELGSFEACAGVANNRRESTITELRACLFFEQRRWQHSGNQSGTEDQNYQRGLVEKIREMLENDSRK